MNERLVQDLEQAEVQTENVKCSGCGSNMVFNPETQTLICNHCGNKKEFGTGAVSGEFDLSESLFSSPKWSAEEAVVFECENCGYKVGAGKVDLTELHIEEKKEELDEEEKKAIREVGQNPIVDMQSWKEDRQKAVVERREKAEKEANGEVEENQKGEEQDTSKSEIEE